MSLISREAVEVLAAFKQGRARPVQFRLGTRTYVVKTVDLTFSERKGRDKIYYFAVHDGANTFRLAYSSETLEWFLETEASMI